MNSVVSFDNKKFYKGGLFAQWAPTAWLQPIQMEVNNKKLIIWPCYYIINACSVKRNATDK